MPILKVLILLQSFSIWHAHRQAAGSDDVSHSGEKCVRRMWTEDKDDTVGCSVCTVLYFLWVIPIHGNHEVRRGKETSLLTRTMEFSLFHRAFWFIKFYSHQLMHFLIQPCCILSTRQIGCPETSERNCHFMLHIIHETDCPETSVRNCHFMLHIIHETDCPETSVRNCHCTLCNIPEERRFHKIHLYILKSRKCACPRRVAYTVDTWAANCHYSPGSGHGMVQFAVLWPHNTHDIFCCSLSAPYWHWHSAHGTVQQGRVIWCHSASCNIV
jgi:hypothetical protein